MPCASITTCDLPLERIRQDVKTALKFPSETAAPDRPCLGQRLIPKEKQPTYHRLYATVEGFSL